MNRGSGDPRAFQRQSRRLGDRLLLDLVTRVAARKCHDIARRIRHEPRCTQAACLGLAHITLSTVSYTARGDADEHTRARLRSQRPRRCARDQANEAKRAPRWNDLVAGAITVNHRTKRSQMTRPSSKERTRRTVPMIEPLRAAVTALDVVRTGSGIRNLHGGSM